MTVKEAIRAVCETAEKQVGYKAADGKRTKYAEYLDKVKDFYNGPKNGFDWCDVFVDWLFSYTFGTETGRQMIYQPKKSLGAGVGYSAGYYKANNAFKKIPELGSQIFFGSAHTGIVVDISGDYIYTVEGNTGGGAGQVQRKKYLRTNPTITGYGIPNWKLATKEKEKVDYKTRINNKCSELAQKAYDTLQGEYGNGSDRVTALGSYYTPVQWIINEILKE